MTLNEIERQLCSKNTSLNPDIKNELIRIKCDAIAEKNEHLANELWCYEQIYSIQHEYYSAYEHMKNAASLDDTLDKEGYDSPKSRSYEIAWNELDSCDMHISFLEDAYCISSVAMKEFHVNEIKEDALRLFPLFPYRYFLSRETIIEEESCSICGQTISIRHPCGHRVGSLYMGERCRKNVERFRFLGASIVTRPFDRYAIVKTQGDRFDFCLLDYLIPKIEPYSKWSYSKEKRLLPEFKGIRRNDRCPCGSGKKFKYCIRDNQEKHLEDHYIFSIPPSHKPILQQLSEEKA